MSDPSTAALVSTPQLDRPDGTGTPEAGPPAGGQRPEKPRGLLSDAWHDLRRNPLFWISATLILLFVVMAALPSLFTHGDPVNGVLARSRMGPSAEGWFGYDLQGRDVYARTIYGARASMVVALLSTIGTVLLGGALGVVTGYRGGWIDSLLSRISDVFFGLPFMLGALVILATFNGAGTNNGEYKIIGMVIITVVGLSWPIVMRLMRSSVLATKEADYVLAARGLGASTTRIALKHLLPNCLAPLLIYAMIMVGTFIGAEATLSFLGIGLKQPVVSWGISISDGQRYLRESPHILFFPSAFLITAVISFVMLGEAIREALDPKLR